MTITDETLESYSQIIRGYVEDFQESGNFDFTSDNISTGQTITAEGKFIVHRTEMGNGIDEPFETELTHEIQAESVLIDNVINETQYELTRAELTRLNKKLRW